MEDLRRNLADEFENDDDNQELPIDFDEIEAQQTQERQGKPTKFLGMTAGERAFVSMLFFFIILIFGAAILAVTGRITL